MRMGFSLSITQPRTGVGVAINPVISIQSGSGYAGSVYASSVAGQWSADGLPIAGATGATWTMTLQHEGAAISCGNSNAIRMWMPDDLDAAQRSGGRWLDPKRAQTVSGGYVTALPDQFGGEAFTQTVAANQPVAGTINGRPVLDMTTGYRFIDAVTPFYPVYIAIVGQYGDGTVATFSDLHAILGLNNAGGSSSAMRGRSGAGSWNSVGSFSGIVAKNGGVPSDSALPMPMSLLATVLGAVESGTWGFGKSAAANGTRNWPGYVAEAVLLPSDPDNETKLRIEGCIAHRNGIAALLPADHQYRNLGPRVS